MVRWRLASFALPVLLAVAPARADPEAHRTIRTLARRLDCQVAAPQSGCALPSRRVEITFPRDWRLSEQPTYPGILVSARHQGRGEGRMTLAVQEVADDVTVRAYGEKNRRALERVGFVVRRTVAHPSGALILEAVAPDRQTRVRQGYRVEAGMAYVLTLSAPAKSLRAYARAFDDTLRGLGFARFATAAAARGAR